MRNSTDHGRWQVVSCAESLRPGRIFSSSRRTTPPRTARFVDVWVRPQEFENLLKWGAIRLLIVFARESNCIPWREWSYAQTSLNNRGRINRFHSGWHCISFLGCSWQEDNIRFCWYIPFISVYQDFFCSRITFLCIACFRFFLGNPSLGERFQFAYNICQLGGSKRSTRGHW